MKKTLLLIFTFTTLFAYSQNGCLPDPQFTAAGIYPDSATGLSIGLVGQAYSENITIITPTDTDVVYLGAPINVTIDNIDLTSVTGLPNNFTYACDPPSCSFPGGSVECAELYSTVNPTMADVGLYPLILSTTTYVSGVPIIGTTTQNDIIDYYYIEIFANPPVSWDCTVAGCVDPGTGNGAYTTLAACQAACVTPSWDCVGNSCIDPGTGNGAYTDSLTCMTNCNTTAVINKFTNSTFELRDVFPNPVNDQARIQFITGKADEVTFLVFNLLGEEVEKRIIAANRGVNDIVFNASNYSRGVYTYSINNGQDIITKRMIIVPKNAF